MSTAEIFIEQDDVEGLVADTRASDLLMTYGEEGRELGICPFLTVYMRHREDEFLDLADELIEIFQTFQQRIIDEPFALVRLDKKDDWIAPTDPRAVRTDLQAVARRRKDELEMFCFGGTDMPSTAQTARWSFMATLKPGNRNAYSRLKINFRLAWYRRHTTEWHAFVLDCLQRLRPDHAYSGFEVGNGDFNLLGAYEADVLERVLADHFYGLDIDHPVRMGGHNFLTPDEPAAPTDLGAGLRTPTWCFLLSPYWLDRLGKSEREVRAALSDPRVDISTVDYPKGPQNPAGRPGLWIRLGDLDLHPVDQGVPELPVIANRLIRPIRCDQLPLLTLDAWDGDPNPRFDHDSSLRWMRRFDSNGNWPPGATPPGPPGGTATEALRGEPGAAVPRSGLWWTPALTGAQGRRHFKAGEHFPPTRVTAWGGVVWYFDSDAGPDD